MRNQEEILKELVPTLTNRQINLLHEYMTAEKQERTAYLDNIMESLRAVL